MIISSKDGATSDLKKSECCFPKPASRVMPKRYGGLVITTVCCRPVCLGNNKINVTGSDMWLVASTCYEQTRASKDW